jgi:predicted ferric reductase
MAVFGCLPALAFLPLGKSFWPLSLWAAKLSAFLAFGWLVAVLVLASRHHAFEQRLGGLDAMYLMHHIAGMSALVFMVLHPALLAVAFRDSLSTSSWFLPWAGVDTLLGTAAALLAAMLVLLSICHWLPYQRWLVTHRGMGAVLALSALHTFRIGSNVGGAMGGILYAYLVIGTAAYLYKVFLYPRLGPSAPAEVASLSIEDGATVLGLRLSRRLAPIQPGQFVYVSLHDPSVPPEPHPFSVVRAEEGRLTLAIAPSGDYTHEVRKVSVGSRATVYGPYGAMHRHYLRKGKAALWIAGGIGITPFVSLWEHAAEARGDLPVALIWSVRGAGTPFLTHAIHGANSEGMTYIQWDSRTSGRLTGAKVAELAPFAVADANVMLCGPNAMMYDLSKQLISLGVPAGNIYYETFSYRD